MRKFIVLILSAAFTLTAAARTYPQSKFVSLDLDNVSISELFNEIKKQTNYSFFFNEKRMAELDKITIHKSNTKVSTVLDEVLKNSNMTYNVVDGVIVIVENKSKAAQVLTVTGTVYDSKTNDVLPGVTVSVKNSGLGTSTDFDGKFSIKIPREETILIFSYIGFKTQEVLVKESKEISVKLEEEVQGLDEIVLVSTGYQVLDKRELTSSISSVGAEDLDIVGAISVDKMLEGKSTGLMITNLSSTPGAAAKIRVRSGSTFTGNQSPLWVVDGVIYEDPVPLSASEINSFDNINVIGNALTGINPNDIAKIDILKDASATAIYGTRAANGVIVVTTKRGKQGKPVLSYSGGFSFVQAPTYSDLNLMNSLERIDVSREMYERNLGYSQSYDNIDRLGYEGALMNLWDGTYNHQQFQDRVSYLETLNSDWFGALYQNAFSQNHALSASGGSENAKYYFSLGYDDQQGAEQNVGLNRITARSNLDLDVRDNLKLSFRVNGSVQEGSYNHTSVNLFNTAYYTARTIPIYNEDGTYFLQSQQIYAADKYGPRAYAGYNVLKEMDNSERNITNKDLTITGTLNWKFLKNFRFNSQVSYRNTTNLTEEWITEDTYYAARLRTYDAFEDLIQQRVDLNSELPFGGVYNGGMVSQDTYSITNQLNYNLSKGKNVFNVNLGQEARSINYWGATGFTVPGYNHYQGRGFIALPNLSSTTNDDNESIKDYASYGYDAMMDWLTSSGSFSVYPTITDRVTNSMSYFGILNYVYDSRYVLNFNMRSDGSNQFGQYERYKFKPTWSVSGRWNLHNEKFLENSTNVNELALRASYGVRGTMPNTSPYLIISNYGRNNAVYYPENTAQLSEFPNANLRWEKTTTTDLGLNYSFFEGRLSGALDYSYSKSEDLLQARPISLVNGSATQMFNSGSKDVSNYEMSLRAVLLKQDDLALSTNFNFSYSKDRVLKGFEDGAQLGGLTVNDYLSGSIYRAGFPTNGFFAYKFAGLNDKGLPTFENLVMEGATPEQQLEAVLEYQGSRVPLYYGGFGLQLRSGNFNFSANFTYKLGYKTRLLPLYNGNQNLPLPYENMSGEFNNRWRQPGDELVTNIPTITNYNQSFTGTAAQADGLDYIYVTNNSYIVPSNANAWWMYDRSDARIVNADHIRLQSLTFSYNIPNKLIEGAGISNLNLGIQGSNLSYFAFDKDLRGQDPEQVSGVGLPALPTYSLSVNMSF